MMMNINTNFPVQSGKCVSSLMSQFIHYSLQLCVFSSVSHFFAQLHLLPNSVCVFFFCFFSPLSSGTLLSFVW